MDASESDLLARHRAGRARLIAAKARGEPRPPGVGDRLAHRLADWGLHEGPECHCKAIRRTMNALGPDGCERRIEVLVAEVAANVRAGKFTAEPGVTATAAAVFLRLGVGIEAAARRLIRDAIQECRDADAAIDAG